MILEKKHEENILCNYQEERNQKGEEKEEEEEELEVQKEEGIKEEKIRKTIGKIKLKKARGVDRIPMEAQKYASESVWKKLVELLNQVWKKKEIVDWKKSIIAPLYKRGDKEEVENQRNIVALLGL